MGERKGEEGNKQTSVPKLVTQGHPGRNLYSATEGSHVSRGRKWRYSSNANVGSPSTPSLLKLL